MRRQLLRASIAALWMAGSLCWPAGPARAEEQAETSAPASVPATVWQAAETAESASVYLIHPGDKLMIQVYRESDLSGAFVVNGYGKINYPLLGDIHVSGLTLDDLKEYLTEALGKDYLVDPQVEITFAESPSKSVSILGQVTNPGNYVLDTNLTLVRLISKVGGFTIYASTNNVKILRRGPDDTKRHLQADVGKIMTGESPDVPLLPGDMVFVDKEEDFRDKIILLGQVQKPGNYTLTEELTLVRLISLAGGLLPDSSTSNVRITRRSADGTDASMITDMGKILEGRQEDVRLQANDIIYVEKAESAGAAVSVLGHVQKPGNYNYATGMTIIRLISQAGGFTQLAAPNRVRLVRWSNRERNQRTSIQVDVNRIMDGSGADVELQAGDLVVVPESLF